MFDGADLSAVYGAPSYDQVQKQAPQPIPEPTKQPVQLQNPIVTEANAFGKPVMPSTMSLSEQQSFSRPKSFNNNDSFWDKIGNKKPEIVKLFMFSLIIVLGLSLDRLAGHYITDYISNAVLTNVQEFVVRLSYPVGVVLFLWILKASM